MPVTLKTVVLATACGVTCVAPQPVTVPTAVSVVAAPVATTSTTPKKIVVAAKLSYEEELMKKYNELKELENHWNR